jgi:RHS repeat-associated protein
MVGVSGAATASYAHNALGQRVRKAVGSSTTYFVYDEAGHLVGEYDGAGNLIQEIAWFEDTPVASLRNVGGSVTAFYIHADHLNTPRKITRPSDNAILWRWDSDPFGTDAANEDPDGDTVLFAFNLRFPGQYHDAETGFSYNYFRDYSPAVGRYFQSDPIGLDGGINTYAYVDGNPANFWDRLGLAKCRYSISKHTMICESDDGSRAGMVGPQGLFSGFGGCRNNPECIGNRSEGPIPPGDYEMIPSDKYGGSWWLKEKFLTRQLCKLGMGRCEFFFHRGTFSEGCITAEGHNSRTSGQFERIRRILRGDSRNRLTVEP